VVKCVSAGLQLVVHVQGYDHAHVHVDELGRQVEVALQIAGIDDIDDHVGSFVDDEFAHIALFGGIGRKAVGARQVDEAEAVALKFEVPFLGIYRHTAIVSHVLVCTACNVEE